MQEIETRYLDILGSENKHGRWNGTKKVWRYVEGFRQIELAGCDDEADKEKYKGRAHDLKAFDELPDFTFTQYQFITTWNRSAMPGQRCRVVGAGNPPTTADGEWVIQRWRDWIDEQTDAPAQPGELRWYATIEDIDTRLDGPDPFMFKGEEIIPRSRTFIPALVSDNSFLRTSNYRSVLANLPAELRDKFLKGDFRIMRGSDPMQVIPTEWIRAAQERWVPDGCRGKTIKRVGVDVARGGIDNTICAVNFDDIWFAPLQVTKGIYTKTGDEAAQKVVAACDGTYPEINVDIIGVGSSCYDSLRNLGYRTNAITNNEREVIKDNTDKTGKLGFYNWRAYAMWMLREALDPQFNSQIMLPPGNELLRDLSAPKWSMRPGSKRPLILVESKDELKKRIGRSTDYGDALVNAFIKAPTNWAKDAEALKRLLGG